MLGGALESAEELRSRQKVLNSLARRDSRDASKKKSLSIYEVLYRTKRPAALVWPTKKHRTLFSPSAHTTRRVITLPYLRQA